MMAPPPVSPGLGDGDGLADLLGLGDVLSETEADGLVDALGLEPADACVIGCVSP